LIIAFGGGSVGNLVGLAAAMSFRGIRYVEVPTSFTHMTDGVLSNKQAINGRMGKNHFGVYYAPVLIWADARYLATEPIRSKKAGIAEAIKNALISQPELVGYFRKMLRSDCGYGPEELSELALTTILSKLEILRRDPSEKHYALVLEYGHTFGHAIEWLSRGELLHGECVAVGMKMVAHLANEQKLISNQVLDLHYELFDKCLGLVPALPPHIDARSVLATMTRDNKKTGDSFRFVLLDRLGSCGNEEGDYLVTIPDNGYLLGFLERFLNAYPRRLETRRQSSRRAKSGEARLTTQPAEVLGYRCGLRLDPGHLQPTISWSRP
jgi:3-dehydroquinate synthase